MADEYNSIRDVPVSAATVDIVPQAPQPPLTRAAWELAPREPHLWDYLLILRKHQWLILSFMLAVVTIVSIATFRMQPVYVASTRIELGRETANVLPSRAPIPTTTCSISKITSRPNPKSSPAKR